MAAFSDVGAHCALPTCGQQDFLPFVCSRCGGTFCGEHRQPHQHACVARSTGGKGERGDLSGSEGLGIAPVCPVCGLIVTEGFTQGQRDAVDVAVDRHLQSGKCPGPPADDAELDDRVRQAGGLHTVPCSLKGCKNREVLPLQCGQCHSVFCVKHRHGDDHACPAALRATASAAASATRTAEARAKSRSIFGDALAALQKRFQTKGAGAGGSAQRLAATRLQNRSVAASKTSVAASDRFFLDVDLSMAKPGTTANKSLYFNREWKVGKVLDLICDAVNVTNRNNIAGARKLYLVSLRTGEPLETSVTLADYHENNILRSGDTVALAYAS